MHRSKNKEKMLQEYWAETINPNLPLEMALEEEDMHLQLSLTGALA